MLFVLSIWIMHQRSKAGGALSKTMVSITLLLFVVLTAVRFLSSQTARVPTVRVPLTSSIST